MIQSDIFDSSNMNIKKVADIALKFTIKRLIEIFGFFVALIGILIFASLVTYSPEDPNFIFPENTEIQNILGFYGSYTSDIFLQSIGITSYFFSLTLVFTGINIFRVKEFFLIIENIFFIILYIISFSLFFSFFYTNAFELYINGNGGFVGNYLKSSFLNNIIVKNENVAFYFLLILSLFLFLMSINLTPRKLWFQIKKVLKNEDKNYTDKSEIINEYIPQEEIKNLIQEDLPFIKAEKFKPNEKFKLPDIKLLKSPSKKEREMSTKNEDQDPNFLEKILLDFGVNGKIKKVSHGPVVTLNEFEPAAGIKD